MHSSRRTQIEAFAGLSLERKCYGIQDLRTHRINLDYHCSQRREGQRILLNHKGIAKTCRPVTSTISCIERTMAHTTVWVSTRNHANFVIFVFLVRICVHSRDYQSCNAVYVHRYFSMAFVQCVWIPISRIKRMWKRIP